ncbi:hypothetical protein [Actinophytocola glycyrrhizae]|uniref:Mce-associated membrane protein n=1 Tax=Actinophytocola glycyrrhizae TaxID=2044873 RepID=A0ABV9RYR5_9PSEU
MADNEHPREHDPAAPPPAVREPTDITPDQVRQFQEFQRFQELMREQAEKGLPPGSPPPGLLQPWGPPPPRESLPKRLLKSAVSKIVTGLVVLAILVLGGYLAIDYFFGENHDQLPASQTGGGKTRDNLILDTNPYETVRKIYHHIANGENGVPEQVCLRFQDRGEEFAEDMGYADCTAAVRGLAGEVTDSNAYAESMPSYTTTEVPGEQIRISSCEDNIRGGIQGGPALGVFTVSKIAGSKGGQWIITGHQTEPACPTGSAGPTGPTS